MKFKNIEAIAINKNDCIALKNCNVTRIELCEQMEHGGLTPKFENIKECLQSTKIPIRVMVRNRHDSFSYSDEDIDVMCEQIQEIKKLGAEGVVFGCNDGNKINIEHLKKLVEVAKPMKISYHRAFDELSDPIKSINVLEQNGIDTILTSGGPISVENEDNMEKLKVYNENVEKIEILAGGGVNLTNIKSLEKCVDSIHIGSAIRIDETFENEIDTHKLLLI